MTSDKKKPGPKSKPTMVTVECICSNVHLGPDYGQKVLRATREDPASNWENGDTEMVDEALAKFMVSKKMVKIL